MILEVARSLTDWLNSNTTGLVAQLALIPLESGDSVPSVGTIADETRNDLVGQQRLPGDNGIAVNIPQLPMLDGEVTQYTRDGIADVVIRIGRTSVSTKDAIRDTSYIARAGIRSLRLYNAQQNTRNSIAIYSCLSLGIVSLWESIDDQQITHGIKGRWQFRDLIP